MRAQELKGLIVSHGKTCKDVADYLGIADNTFYRKLKKGVFGSDEIDKIIEFLEIKDPKQISYIFFDLE